MLKLTAKILCLTFLFFSKTQLSFSAEENNENEESGVTHENENAVEIPEEVRTWITKIKENASYSKEEAERICEKIVEAITILQQNATKIGQEIFTASKELLITLAKNSYDKVENITITIIEKLENIIEKIKTCIQENKQNFSWTEPFQNISTKNQNQLIMSSMGILFVMTTIYRQGSAS